MIQENLQEIRFKVLEAQLPNIPFKGWEWSETLVAAKKVGVDKEMCLTLFPEQRKSVLLTFARWLDAQMISALADVDISNLGIRERLALAIETRLDVLSAHKEAERLAVGSSLVPSLKPCAMKSLWQTADVMWTWAGDTSDDYNHYTKRGLLSAVLGKVIFYWLDDDSQHNLKTKAFIMRELNKIVARGKVVGKVKPVFDLFWKLKKAKMHTD